jgi:(2Fe-2S) ferredoxin
MSFYNPHIFACTNRRPDDHPRGSCGARNAEALRQYMREKLKSAGVDNDRLKDARANMAGCMDQCENGPVLVVYPEGIWYRAETNADIDRIVDEHLVGGNIVTDLQLTERLR